MVGGAAVTEEFFPGFRNSVAAYTVSLLNPKIIADLRLFEHGLRIVERRAQNFLPTIGRRYLLAAEGHTERNSRSSAAPMPNGTPGFNRELDASADLLRELVLQAPPNLTRGLNLGALGEVLKAGRSATGFDGCPRKICARCSTCSPNRQVTISMAGSRAIW